MKFRFKNRLSFLFSSRLILRLLVIFLLLTFLSAAYLYGLIEISPNKVTIKMYPPDIDEIHHGVESYSKLDNMTNLFFKIERYNLMIKTLISPVDVKVIENLKAKYEKEDKKSTENKKKEDEEEEEEEEEKDEQNLAMPHLNQSITRDNLIKCLKYEKILLKKKMIENKILTVSKLVADYIDKNEIEKE
jgi:hypothetical protein